MHPRLLACTEEELIGRKKAQKAQKQRVKILFLLLFMALGATRKATKGAEAL